MQERYKFRVGDESGISVLNLIIEMLKNYSWFSFDFYWFPVWSVAILFAFSKYIQYYR